jgi:hypothetical protein
MGVVLEGTRSHYTRLAITAAAAATGGEVHDAGSVVGVFKTIYDNLRRSYVLSYTVTGVPRGGWHSVTVRLPRFPNYEVRARAGYLGR